MPSAALVALAALIPAPLPHPAVALAPTAAPATAPDGDRQPDPLPRRGVLPVLAAVVPGLVIHGSGHYVAGDKEGARRLLATESVGLGIFAGGVAGLSLTGASRRLVVPFEVATVTGVGLMGLTAMASLYGVSAPAGGLGGADPWVPAWQADLGAQYVRNPTFPYRWIAGLHLAAWVQRVCFALQAAATPDRLTQRTGASGAYRFLGSRPGGAGQAPGRPTLDLTLGVLHHRERRGSGPYDLLISELAVGGRFPVGGYLRSLEGSFVEWAGGASIAAYHYGGQADTTEYNDALLLRFGYGFYLGRGPAPRGEVLLVYDHRHDDFAGGLKVPGLGSGPAGHFGIEGSAFFTQRWGLAGQALFGSAHLYALSLRWRGGGPW